MENTLRKSAATVCPGCSADLSSGGLERPMQALCLNCGRVFLTGRTAADVRSEAKAKTSRLAVMSLVLGLIPGACATALPAIILGLVALSRIDRHRGEVRGRGLALAGVAAGTILGIVFPLWAAGGVILLMNAVIHGPTSNTREIDAMSRSMVHSEVPAGLVPFRGNRFFGHPDRVEFRNTRSHTGVHSIVQIRQFPSSTSNQADVRSELDSRFAPVPLESEPFVIPDQQTAFDVTRQVFVNQSGLRFHRYMGVFETTEHIVAIDVLTLAPPPGRGGALPGLSDDAVRRFFASITPGNTP